MASTKSVRPQPPAAQRSRAAKSAVKTAAADKSASGGTVKTTRRPTTKHSALDAALRVLRESDGPFTCKQLVEAMAAKGYWTSPGGKTPQATLYSAILREISTKGADARLRKAAPGKFELA